jgi:hypothetical protein
MPMDTVHTHDAPAHAGQALVKHGQRQRGSFLRQVVSLTAVTAPTT